VGQHADDLRRVFSPALQHPAGQRAPGEVAVPLDHSSNHRQLRLGGGTELYHLRVAAAGETAVGIQHVSDAARHPGCEVPPGRTEHHHAAAGHVLAAVVAHGLDYRIDPGVAHAEPLAGDAADVRFSRRGAVKRDVADDDVL